MLYPDRVSRRVRLDLLVGACGLDCRRRVEPRRGAEISRAPTRSTQSAAAGPRRRGVTKNNRATYEMISRHVQARPMRQLPFTSGVSSSYVCDALYA
eukprot:2076396-Prymnesium_polylepis.3